MRCPFSPREKVAEGRMRVVALRIERVMTDVSSKIR